MALLAGLTHGGKEAIVPYENPDLKCTIKVVSLRPLHQANPEVYGALASTMAHTREVQEQRNNPKQIGQLVAKQDNNYMMGELQVAHILQLLQTKNKQNGNDGRREEDAF